jgi:anaerobic dimethyl sulfoxide reductase subunit B (iron-sulfur subunit)
MPDLIEIVKKERGEFPNLSLKHLFLTCFHCAKPACIRACPKGLLMKRAEDGIVVITNSELCTNCELCAKACPYHAPKTKAGGSVNIVKCNLCLDRISKNRPTACVSACPTHALDAGPIDELIAKYGELRELEGFANYRITRPSVMFRRGSSL